MCGDGLARVLRYHGIDLIGEALWSLSVRCSRKKNRTAQTACWNKGMPRYESCNRFNSQHLVLSGLMMLEN